MSLSDFIEGGVSTGTMQPLSGGLHAFIPNPLPPKWEMPIEFWPLLRDAWATIRELNGTAHHDATNDECLKSALGLAMN